MNRAEFLDKIEAKGFKFLPYSKRTWGTITPGSNLIFPCWVVSEKHARLFTADRPFTPGHEVLFDEQPEFNRDAYDA